MDSSADSPWLAELAGRFSFLHVKELLMLAGDNGTFWERWSSGSRHQVEGNEAERTFLPRCAFLEQPFRAAMICGMACLFGDI